jgi:hypothetical protein
METDISGNLSRESVTGMEYSDGLMDMHIKDNLYREKEKVMHITGGQMEMNITVS